MPRTILLACATLLLAGCLTTTKPVFDETNSKPVAEIPEFLAYADAWETFVAASGTPRELIATGARGVVIDGFVVVQEHADYYAFTTIGGRPLSCVIFADKNIETVAKAHGVTIEIQQREGIATIDDAPANVTADGPDAALLAFVRDQFANQRLACLATPRGG